MHWSVSYHYTAMVKAAVQPAAPDELVDGAAAGACSERRARVTLNRQGIPARVVSMPSWELFEQQDQSYRDGVLPPNITARVSVEMGSVIGWDRYVGTTGAKVGMTTFGSSAPLKDLLTKFGFTPAKVLAAAKEQIAKSKGTT